MLQRSEGDVPPSAPALRVILSAGNPLLPDEGAGTGRWCCAPSEIWRAAGQTSSRAAHRWQCGSGSAPRPTRLCGVGSACRVASVVCAVASCFGGNLPNGVRAAGPARFHGAPTATAPAPRPRRTFRINTDTDTSPGRRAPPGAGGGG
jgi:hypothetical protein